MNESRIWTPGANVPPPVVDGALEELYRRERRKERDRWKHIRDPRLPGLGRHCAITHINATQFVDHSGLLATKTTGSFNIATTGNGIILASYVLDLGAGNPSITAGGVTLSGGGTFQQDAVLGNGAPPDSRIYLHSLFGASVTSGSHTIAIVCSSNVVNITSFIIEVSGEETTSWFDSSRVLGTGTGTQPTAGAHTAGVSGGYWISFFGSEAAAAAGVSVGSGWTSGLFQTASASDPYAGFEYRIPGTVGPFTGDFLGTGPSGIWAALIGVYKAAAAGGGPAVVDNKVAGQRPFPYAPSSPRGRM